MKVDKLKYIGLIFIVNLHVPDLAYTNAVVGRMKSLFETAAVGMRANVFTAKVMLALIPDGEPMEEVGRFKYSDSMLTVNRQGS